MFQEKIDEIKFAVEHYLKKDLRLFISSSFQTHSIPLLHIFSQINKSIPVYFLQTGFHFPETIKFKNQVASYLEIEVFDIKSDVPKIQQRDSNHHFYFASNPDYCCFLNKTQPMKELLLKNDVWVNGIRADQNINRKGMKIEQAAPHQKLRYHPMLNWSKQEIYRYIHHFNLPKHPLDEKGYLSVGCEPCTHKPNLNERDGRWMGQNKTECGLHTDLVTK